MTSPLPRAAAAVSVALLALVGLSACSQNAVSAADAYRIGCPALDSVVGGGTLANKATVAGLEALRDSRQLGDEAQSWLESAIKVVKSGKPNDLPADARATLVNGCKDNGYALRNLR